MATGCSFPQQSCSSLRRPLQLPDAQVPYPYPPLCPRLTIQNGFKIKTLKCSKVAVSRAGKMLEIPSPPLAEKFPFYHFVVTVEMVLMMMMLEVMVTGDGKMWEEPISPFHNLQNLKWNYGHWCPPHPVLFIWYKLDFNLKYFRDSGTRFGRWLADRRRESLENTRQSKSLNQRNTNCPPEKRQNEKILMCCCVRLGICILASWWILRRERCNLLSSSSPH